MADITQPNKEDIQRVLAFMHACDTAEFGEPDTSVEDLEESWDEIDLSQDAWIAEDDRGLAAYTAVYGGGQRYTMDFYQRTDSQPRLMDGLITSAVQRVLAMKAAEDNHVQARLVAYASSVNQVLAEALERNRFVLHTYHYRMQIDLDKWDAAPCWPPEYSLSAFQDGDEDELFSLIQSTFDWGTPITDRERWKSAVFRGGRFDPDLMVMLRRGGQLVGAALSYDEEPMGWIRQLAVAKELQGQGVGSKLLKHMFGLFKQRGLTQAGLGVASANQNACAFYERCGMNRTREFREYSLDL